MHKILLYYQYVPEYETVYLLEVSCGERDKILACHDKIINADDDVDGNLEWLSGWLADKQDRIVYDTSPKAPREQRKDPVVLSHACTLVVTGFAL